MRYISTKNCPFGSSCARNGATRPQASDCSTSVFPRAGPGALAARAATAERLRSGGLLAVQAAAGGFLQVFLGPDNTDKGTQVSIISIPYGPTPLSGILLWMIRSLHVICVGMGPLVVVDGEAYMGCHGAISYVPFRRLAWTLIPRPKSVIILGNVR
jgi:hypothetical protein